MEGPDTRERLIRITADELARNGYRSMSLRGIAARAEGVSAEDTIVGRAESFWDFLDAKPELAAMLLHESFDKESQEGDLLQQHAGDVIHLAVTFIDEAQRRGEIGSFDTRRFLLWGALHIIGYHGAPRIHQHLFGDGRDKHEERDAFLSMMRAYLQGRMPGSE